jgi:hypothetical protein
MFDNEKEETLREREIRKIVRSLVDKWLPWGVERSKSQGSWGLGSLGSIFPGEGENDPPFWFWINSLNRKGLGTQTPIHDLDQLRASAISILVFCEAEEMRRELEKKNDSLEAQGLGDV